jgi:hypothetical protein
MEKLSRAQIASGFTATSGILTIVPLPVFFALVALLATVPFGCYGS